jgi:hypothetical protein
MPTSHLTKTKLSKYKGSRHKIEPMQIDSQKFDYNDMHRQEDMHTLTNHLHTQKRELILVDKAQYLKKGHGNYF